MKVVLSIAGSDSSGGAGIQADLKTFEAFGVFGTSAITVLTSQNTQGVKSLKEMESSFIKEQIEAVFEDFEVGAIKIGMLYSNAIIDTIRDIIKTNNIPIVLDPVFISKAGSKLLSDDAIANMKSLFPYVTLITPNLYEAKELFGYEVGSSDSEKEFLQSKTPIVIKNHIQEVKNHLRSIDILYQNGEKTTFETPHRETSNTHGTGCSYSSAIASNLAIGKSLEESIAKAKKFVYLAIKYAPDLGKGAGVIHHKIGGEICHIREN